MDGSGRSGPLTSAVGSFKYTLNFVSLNFEVHILWPRFEPTLKGLIYHGLNDADSNLKIIKNPQCDIPGNITRDDSVL